MSRCQTCGRTPGQTCSRQPCETTIAESLYKKYSGTISQFEARRLAQTMIPEYTMLHAAAASIRQHHPVLVVPHIPSLPLPWTQLELFPDEPRTGHRTRPFPWFD